MLKVFSLRKICLFEYLIENINNTVIELNKLVLLNDSVTLIQTDLDRHIIHTYTSYNFFKE